MAWPTSVSSDTDLYVAVNNFNTTLNGAIDNVVTSVTLTDASALPATGGYVTIGTEAIKYTAKSGNTLTGCTRGADGTLAVAHANGSSVFMFFVADHHNVLKNEISALETDLEVRISKGDMGFDVFSNSICVNDGFGNISVTMNGGNGTLEFYEFPFTSGNFVRFQAPTGMTAPYTVRWPVDSGLSGQVLTSNGTDPNQLYWSTPGGGSLVLATTSVSTATTLDATHYTVRVDATSASVTITLPAASGCTGRIYNVKKIDSSANNVVIDGNGAELIDGAATITFNTQYQCYTIQSNGTGWDVI